MSLATKLEEHHAPRLSELPLDACEFAFDRASVLRMELLVLGTLEWRMVAVTPFPYISCFAARFGQDERRAVLVRAVECVFAAIRGWPFPLSHPRAHSLPFHGVGEDRGRD
jgi:cyclin D5, plant